ncbi:hypothetical protein OAO01_05265 [Oligoflexia bacterium]|nr:hypothetical protein [Oligoflexia bacterium]
MAVCLDYQSVYAPRHKIVISVRMQLFAAVFLLVSLAAKVWIKVETTQVGYELAQRRELAVQYDMQRRDLNLQLSILLRPDNLSKMAQERLGLVPLDPRQARKIP